MNEQPPPTPPEEETPLNIERLEPHERVSYILGIRRRITEGEEVSDDEIRDAVRLIRLDRAGKASARKGSKSTAPPVTLADF